MHNRCVNLHPVETEAAPHNPRDHSVQLIVIRLLERVSFGELLFNPAAQAKFIHTVGADYVVGSLFVLSISAFHLLRGRHTRLPLLRPLALPLRCRLPCWAMKAVIPWASINR